MVICVILFIICLILCGLIVRIKAKYNKLKSDISKIYIAIKHVRYGDINVRVDNLNNKDLETIANRLFETLADREMMIKEYQSTLSNKNISLEQIIEQEKQLQEFKEEFAATLTHDMKVPVIAELNSLNFLLDGRFGDLNEKQVQILTLMKSSNQELKELIENMLETYRLEQKNIELNITTNNVNQFMESVIQEMNQVAQATGHSLITDFTKTNNIEVNFDIFQMKRVLKNIIQNAITHSAAESAIKINTQITENKLNLSVSNKGSGISPEDIELIFQKYYSGHSKFKKAGTGLGLYLAGKIIDAHNGKIIVNSDNNSETIFTVELSR